MKESGRNQLRFRFNKAETFLTRRLHEYEGCVTERETLIQENARLKMDMVAMVPKLDSKSPRKASAIAEFDRLTEKLQVGRNCIVNNLQTSSTIPNIPHTSQDHV